MSLEPPDFCRCQADKPGAGPFALGGDVGNPKRGYLTRCRNTPIYLATENTPGDDGLVGRMTLCLSCLDAFKRQMPENYATIEPIYEPGRLFTYVGRRHDGPRLVVFEHRLSSEKWTVHEPERDRRYQVSPSLCRLPTDEEVSTAAEAMLTEGES